MTVHYLRTPLTENSEKPEQELPEISRIRAKFHLYSEGKPPDEVEEKEITSLARKITFTSRPGWGDDRSPASLPWTDLACDQLVRSDHLLEQWCDKGLSDAATLYRQLADGDSNDYQNIINWITSDADREGDHPQELNYFDQQQEELKTATCTRDGVVQFAQIINQVSQATAFTPSGLMLYIAEGVKPIQTLFQIQNNSSGGDNSTYEEANKITINVFHEQINTHHLKLISTSFLKDRDSGRKTLITEKDLKLYHIIKERLEGPPSSNKKQFWSKCIDLAKQEFGIDAWSQPQSIRKRWNSILKKLGD